MTTESTHQDLQRFLVDSEESDVLATKPRDGHAVPVPFQRDCLNLEPYGHWWRVMTLFRCLTGCRIAELDQLDLRLRRGDYMAWKPSKNQSGSRVEELPAYFWREYTRMRELFPCKLHEMWPWKASTYRRHWNKIRTRLPEKWNGYVWVPERQRTGLKIEKEHEMQLKGFRTTFISLIFWRYYEKYRDGHVAAFLTQKRMRHASEHMTKSHYIVEAEAINAQKWSKLSIHDIYCHDIQQNFSS